MKPHDKGGIHAGVTDIAQTYLAVEKGRDVSDCPVSPVVIDHPDPFHVGQTITVTYIPINANIQAHYGPDKQIVTVPINGDAMAQRLHWLKRNKKERTEMRAVLEYLGAWRLTDTGEVPA